MEAPGAVVRHYGNPLASKKLYIEQKARYSFSVAVGKAVENFITAAFLFYFLYRALQLLKTPAMEAPGAVVRHYGNPLASKNLYIEQKARYLISCCRGKYHCADLVHGCIFNFILYTEHYSSYKHQHWKRMVL